MKTLRPAVTAVMLLLVLSPSLAKAASFSRPSAAYDWLDISLEATAREVDRHGARPTIISRTLAIALTAMYDAWAAYDEKAVGTRLGAALRRPAAERTVANKEKAIAYATYRALVDVYPEDKAWIDSQMEAKGFDHAGISDAALVSGQAVCARSQRSVRCSCSAARRFGGHVLTSQRRHNSARAFEDVFLIWACVVGRREIAESAARQAQVEHLSELEQLKSAALEMAMAEMQVASA